MPGGGGAPGGNCMNDIAPGGRLGGGGFSSFCISWDGAINGGGINDGGNPRVPIPVAMTVEILSVIAA